MADAKRLEIPTSAAGNADGLHPAWREFIRYCRELRYGEVQRLTIQDGLPVMAEQIVRKLKFTREE